MRNTKATLVPPFVKLRVPAEIGLILLLASFAACSNSNTSTSATSPRIENRRLTVDPYEGTTPAQRRAAWMKRQPDVQPASATSAIAKKPAVSSN
jgi:hypothetical protein